MLAEAGVSGDCRSGHMGQTGELRLRLGVKGGRTIVKDVFQRAPLKIAKAFYLETETGEAFIYQINPSGGMLQGDKYHMEIELEPGARTFVTTQSAGKIYRTPELPAVQDNKFTVGERAVLEYLPDPVIPFAGSRFISNTEVRLSTGAVAFMAEGITPGRIKRGEVFGFDLFHSKTRVYWDGELILWDNWRLAPAGINPGRLGIYDGYTHQANFYIFAEAVNKDLVEKLSRLFDSGSGINAGASLTAKNGIAVRLLGHRADFLAQAVDACWDTARRELLGIAAPRIRK